jgi:RNA polymerase sigma factor (sigma-70 family)
VTARDFLFRHDSNYNRPMNQVSAKDPRLANLMRSTQDGDASAYTQLLKEVTPLLRQIVRRHRGFLQASDIEDLVQDILLSLHTVRATYDPARPFLPWVTAIARNRMVDGARRYARRTANEVQVEEYPVTFSHEDANVGENGYGDPVALRLAIRKLPTSQREAVEMLKLREMSLKDAAAASGMSIGALKVAVHRATKTLRASLATAERS